MELSLKDIILTLWSKIYVIILSVLVVSIGAFLISYYYIDPTYQSRLSLYVFNDDAPSKETTNNDLIMAQRLVNSYIAILQSDRFLNKVIDDINLEITPSELKSKLKMSAMTDTELFEIIVSSSTPNSAFKIAASITKLAPTAVKQIVQTGRIEVVDTPVIASKQSSPNVYLNTVIGGFIGFIASCLIILVYNMLDIKIKSSEEITNRYSIPVLGTIPMHVENKKNKDIFKDSDRLEKNKDFVRVEGFNTLRNNVRICLKKDNNNKIIITSSSPGDGKSLCSCNLALSFANTDKKVIIIDCDLRKPVMHKTFGLSNKKGLSDILSHLAQISDCIQKTSYNNLNIISAGVEVPNPSELLSSQEMKDVISELEKQYDYIIFDCPPINVVSDAIPLLSSADGVILIVRYNKTTYSDLQKAISTVEFANANLFGIFYYDRPIKNTTKYSYYSQYKH